MSCPRNHKHFGLSPEGLLFLLMLACLKRLGYFLAMGYSIEALRDGELHLINTINGSKQNYPTEIKANVPALLSVFLEPSQPGYYPTDRDGDLITVEFVGEIDDTAHLGSDVYANNGFASLGGDTVPAAIFPCPMPEFMSSDDLGIFFKLWTKREEEAGHVHLPFGVALGAGALKDFVGR